MFKFIFYFAIALFVIYEFTWMFNPKTFVKDRKKFDEMSKKYKDVKYDDMPEEHQKTIKSKIPHLILIVFIFVGLFSFNWLAFLAFIVWNFAVIKPIGKITKYSSAYLAVHWVNSLIGAAWGMFVIINSYHLKIDLLESVKSLF